MQFGKEQLISSFRLEPDAESVDVRLGWKVMDGPLGVLGETAVASTNPIQSATIVFDVEENWYLSNQRYQEQIDFAYVALHEIGHTIGIGHSDLDDTVMYFNYSGDAIPLQPDDISAVQALYGLNPRQTAELFRFFNPVTGGHFFTADLVEKDHVESNTHLIPEGVGFNILSDVTSVVDGVIPIYRFFNKSLGSHFYTGFEAEKDFVAELEGFIFEGIGFYALSSPSSSSQEVYRFFNSSSGGHLFTIDLAEKELLSNLDGFRYEGIAFYCLLE